MPTFPKSQPGKRMRTRKQIQQAADRKGSAACRARSGGRCEVFVLSTDWKDDVLYFLAHGRHPGPAGRCQQRAGHVHHQMSGIGVRGRGQSALAAHKLHVCATCHHDIHAKRLVPDGDSFRRRR